MPISTTSPLPLRRHIPAASVRRFDTVYLRDPKTGKFTDQPWEFDKHDTSGNLTVKRIDRGTHWLHQTLDHTTFVQVDAEPRLSHHHWVALAEIQHGTPVYSTRLARSLGEIQSIKPGWIILLRPVLDPDGVVPFFHAMLTDEGRQNLHRHHDL